MNARSYWKQAQGEIHDDKTSYLSTRDIIKHSKSVLSINVKKDKMDVISKSWCSWNFIDNEQKVEVITFVIGFSM